MKKIKISIWLMIGFLLFQLNIVKADELKIHAIECKVGGDSTLLESNGKYLLMDTCEKNSKNQVLKYLDDQKVTEFDIYLSHYHGDHYGLIMDILNNEKYTVNNIYLPEYNKVDSLINQINSVATEKNINIIYLKKGSEFNFENVKFNIVGPLEGTENLENKINNNSLVAKIKIDNTTFLHAGDIEKEQEALLVKSGMDLKADIMKLSHHGGYTSNTTDFIKAVNPLYTYYEYYTENEKTKFANDSWTKDTIANVNNFSNVLSTGYNGNIIFDIEDDDITVTPTRNYLEATLNYINTNTNGTMKIKKIPYVKNTKFYYSNEELKDYEFLGDDSLSGTVIENQNINLYYQSINSAVPMLAATNDEVLDEENDDDLDIAINDESGFDFTDNVCTEKDGLYYDILGDIVSKDEYYESCGTVDNPITGKQMPLLILVTILLSGALIFIKINKYNKNIKI